MTSTTTKNTCCYSSAAYHQHYRHIVCRIGALIQFYKTIITQKRSARKTITAHRAPRSVPTGPLYVRAYVRASVCVCVFAVYRVPCAIASHVCVVRSASAMMGDHINSMSNSSSRTGTGSALASENRTIKSMYDIIKFMGHMFYATAIYVTRPKRLAIIVETCRAVATIDASCGAHQLCGRIWRTLTSMVLVRDIDYTIKRVHATQSIKSPKNRRRK